ncbi:hypothetical protein BH10ACT11_BH10ACT11_21240 [soil metagenome]
MKKLLTMLALVALASFALAACGSSDSDSSTEASTPADSGSSAGGAKVDITADPSGSLAFTETKVDAKAGASTIELVNDSSTTHNLELEDSNGDDIGKADDVASGTSSFNADLKPGTYTYYCSLPGHREAGMEGTLTVK